MDLITQQFSLNDCSEFTKKIAKQISKQFDIDLEKTSYIRKGLVPSDIKFEDNETSSIDYITTKSVDRDGDIVLPQGAILEHYTKHPIVLYCHKYKLEDGELPLGRSMWIKSDDNGLVSKTQYYTEDSDCMGAKVWRYRKAGFPMAKSIGFIPISYIDVSDVNDKILKNMKLNEDDIKGAERIFTQWVMTEYSDVPVPSNPDALQIAISKGFGTKEDIKKMGNWYVDIEFIENKEVDELDKEVNLTDDELKELTSIAFLEIKNFYNSDGSLKYKNFSDIPVDFSAVVEKYENDENGHISKLFFKDKGQALEKLSKELDLLGVNEVDNNESLIEKDQELEGIKESELDIIIEKELDDFNKEKQEEEIKNETDVIDERIKFFNSLKVKNIDAEKIKKEYVNDFDITQVRTEPAGFEYKIFTKYLGCKIKDIFTTDFFIPNAMKGNFLSAFKNVLSKHELLDQRNFYGNGSEIPLQHSVVKLNSKLEEEFLVTGTQFYKSNDGDRFVFQIYKNWGGLSIDIFTSNKNIELNKSFVRDAIKWVDENNYLKGEKFSIGGEFLEVKEIGWDDVIFPNDEAKDKIKKNIEKLSTKSPSRGMMFIGSPGTGKTLTGKILMNKADTTFIWASSKDFGWGAASALGIGFEMARTLAPSVFFLEDIDTWLSGYTVDLLKTEMDGIRENKGVLTILTSNFPEDIPDALIDRPGRFHHIINFSLPDEDNRIKLLKFFIKDADKDIITEFAKLTDGYSGAHLKELVEFAKMIAEDDGISIEEALIQSLEQMKEQRCLIQDLKNVDKKKDIGNNIETKSIDFIEIEIPVKKSEVEFDFDAIQIKDIFVDKVKKTFDEIDLSDLVEDRIKKAKGIIEFED